MFVKHLFFFFLLQACWRRFYRIYHESSTVYVESMSFDEARRFWQSLPGPGPAEVSPAGPPAGRGPSTSLSQPGPGPVFTVNLKLLRVLRLVFTRQPATAVTPVLGPPGPRAPEVVMVQT